MTWVKPWLCRLDLCKNGRAPNHFYETSCSTGWGCWIFGSHIGHVGISIIIFYMQAPHPPPQKKRKKRKNLNIKIRPTYLKLSPRLDGLTRRPIFLLSANTMLSSCECPAAFSRSFTSWARRKNDEDLLGGLFVWSPPPLEIQSNDITLMTYLHKKTSNTFQISGSGLP